VLIFLLNPLVGGVQLPVSSFPVSILVTAPAAPSISPTGSVAPAWLLPGFVSCII
jgi:hypothetical protein